MNKIKITTFTDPMMGLSYECEPIFRKLETHFKDKIEFDYKMGLLVRNVYDLVNPLDLKVSKKYALDNYLKKLAKIYESEESISGMPINMTNLRLFDEEHISTYPLNLAFKSVEIMNKQLAPLFLYNLRYATIVECKPTNRLEEILGVVLKTGIDKNEFLKVYNDSKTSKLLENDYELLEELNIHTLPAYLIEYEDKQLLIRSLIGYDDFAEIIYEISGIKPAYINMNKNELDDFIKKHPLISPIEIIEAFDLNNLKEADDFCKKISLEEVKVYHGKFYKKASED